MVVHPIIPGLSRWRQKNQKFKVQSEFEITEVLSQKKKKRYQSIYSVKTRWKRQSIYSVKSRWKRPPNNVVLKLSSKSNQ